MTQELDIRFVALGLLVLVLAGAFFAPTMPFIIDGGIYIDMAKAMSDDRSLAIASNGGVNDAPALTKYITRAHEGLVYPRYPSGYALVAAPFYALFGVRGLILMNGLAFLGSAFLVYQIAGQLFRNRFVSFASLGIFTAATFVSNYVTAIWPHMLALLLWLGAIACAISATTTTDTKQRAWMFAASGLIIGIAINIRVDCILIFAILFAWLQLFSRPSDRRAPLLLTIGLVPGFFLAAWLNELKFGTFTPLSYGSSDGLTNLSDYLGMLIAGGMAFIGMWLINVPAMALHTYKRFGSRNFMLVSAVVTCIALLITGDFIIETLYGVYVLVINLQAHNAYFQAGVEPNEFGQLMFWGYPKKALIQSLPFLPLIFIPVFYFLRGKNVKPVSLCLLAIAAPIVFYSMNQWHGGGSYNMRYFIPALPFIAILTATALHELYDLAKPLQRQLVLLVCVSAAILFVGAQGIGRAAPALYAPMALYPQWVIATICAGFATLYLFRRNVSSARAALLMSIFAITYSALLGLENETSHEKARGKLRAHAQAISTSIPTDGLVLTQLPVLLMHAEDNGAAVMVPRENNVEAALDAANAFAQAGRCVYFHNTIVTNLLAPHMAENALHPVPSWAGREAFPDDPRMAFFTLSSQAERCSF